MVKLDYQKIFALYKSEMILIVFWKNEFWPSAWKIQILRKGGKIPVNGKLGQMTTCFAIKTAVQCGLWNKWKNQQKKDQ